MKVHQRLLSFSSAVLALCYLSGCASTGMNRTAMDGTNLYGDPLIIDVPLQDPSGLPSDGDRTLFPAVYFTYDSSVLSPEQSALCEAVAKHLKRGGGVILEGHADERGSREYNLALGERRALAVRAYLLALGIDANQIQTRSFGEEQPADQNHNETAYSQNRRVEFAIY
jgi:peptidoglycan-associated lipoprotein